MDWPALYGLVSHELYRYERSADWPLQAVHVFNLVEGTIWLVFAGLVLNRWRRSGRPLGWEGAYALAFIAFAVTDFREAWCLTTGLLVFKAVILAMLLTFRRIVLWRYYPSRKTW